MAGRQGFITNNETFIFQESDTGESCGFGIDGVDLKWKLQMEGDDTALPSGECMIEISAVDNADILIRPHGTGRLSVTTGITCTSTGLTVDAGDTTLTPIAATATGIVKADSSGVLSTLEDSTTDGQVLISSNAAVPAWALLTAGSNITITPGEGSITIASTTTLLPWNEVTDATVGLAIDNGYVMNRVTLITATLPVTAAVGSMIKIVGEGSGGFLIAQNASQIMRFGGQSTSEGTGGSLASTVAYDCIELVCTVEDTAFVVTSSVGNLTFL